MIASAIWSVPIAWGLTFAPIVARSIIVSRAGKLDNTKPRAVDTQIEKMPQNLKDLTERLRASHNNQYETLGYYAAGVAVAVAVRVDPVTLSRFTGMYIKSRIAYNLAYAAPQVANGGLRSLAFLAAMISVGMLYGAAASAAVENY